MRFEILGRLRAWRDTGEVDLGPGKQRAVLGVLLLNAGRPVASGAIVDAVWGDEPPDNGANVVQKYVAGLRRALEPDRSPRAVSTLLPLTPAGYVLHVPPGGLDVAVFQDAVRSALAERGPDTGERLRAALDLWSGPVLADLEGPVFDAARARYAEERLAAVEELAELEITAGRGAAQVPELLRLAGEFPLRERLRYLLVLALYRSGRQAEALAAYREARDFLVEEFGVEPGERLQQLHLTILRADRVLEPEPPAAPAPPPQPAAWPPGPYAQPVPAPPYGHLPPMFGAAPPHRRWTWMLHCVACAAPALTVGFGGWLVVTVYAALRRSRLLGLSALGFLGLLVLMLVGFSHPEDDDAWMATGLLCLLAIVIGVPVQIVALLARAERGERLSTASAAALERRVRRDAARVLLEHRPDVARQLGVGRPDLPRVFDDGGLVDVNAVPEGILSGLPGVLPQQARLIATVRSAQGPFGSVADLVTWGLLPMHTVRALQEVLVALPVDRPAPPVDAPPADTPPEGLPAVPSRGTV
ncbi:BTAD domain-containing putative transcriptional regulator [Actinomadura parmotrematis]|uniref:Winged helix-turn-helix domain-containing protein n=1 Tax=Actinomadura parmotrematis TaxID=2864039 RepID=A0ABS7FNF8_9ACTN|nr:BTAD domain-containing putative transcriptional regulator [Actinomadura parmotrematis]MBW8481918.1 winged helix-turn-helix domain-containing protein [Actinomadura parmotrematis]